MNYEHSHDTPSSPTPAEIQDKFRVLRVLQFNPEWALSWVYVRVFHLLPSKFADDYGGLTLREIHQQLARDLARKGYPAPLTKHAFRRLAAMLKKTIPRERPPVDSGLPYGQRRLNEFFGPDPGATVASWCVTADALTGVARPQIEAGDDAFARFWELNYRQLLFSLFKWVRNPEIAPDEVVSLTRMAVHLTEDTGGEWDFRRLMCLALRVYRYVPAPEMGKTIYLDEMENEPAHEEDRHSRVFIPDDVTVALLETIFDGKCLPHEVIAFFLVWMMGFDPSEVVEGHSKRPLRDLASDIQDWFLSECGAPDDLIKKLFTRFDRRLALPFRGVTDHKTHLKNHRRLGRLPIGDAPLRRFFNHRSKAARATEVSRWWAKVLSHVETQASQPQSPLYKALERWLRRTPGRWNPFAN